MTDMPLIDKASFEEARSMMKAKFPAILQYFLEDAEGYIGAIRKGVAAGKSVEIFPSAHSLKSSSRQLGAIRLSELAKELELLARNQVESGKEEMRPLGDLLANLEQTFQATRLALKDAA
jgi:HPt (histidine-containing phosphotransfer) domain-containing protein